MIARRSLSNSVNTDPTACPGQKSDGGEGDERDSRSRLRECPGANSISE